MASGVVAYSLDTRQQLWSQHLDLSTALTTFQAFAYSAPTLVDLDRDGLLEVILGTSMVRLVRYKTDQLLCLWWAGRPLHLLPSDSTSYLALMLPPDARLKNV